MLPGILGDGAGGIIVLIGALESSVVSFSYGMSSISLSSRVSYKMFPAIDSVVITESLVSGSHDLFLIISCSIVEKNLRTEVPWSLYT